MSSDACASRENSLHDGVKVCSSELKSEILAGAELLTSGIMLAFAIFEI